MRPLTNKERSLMRHALGLDQSKTAYRNRYISHGRHEDWEGLCGCAAASRDAFGDSKQWVYWVTRAGFDAVKEPDEKHDGETAFDHPN